MHTINANDIKKYGISKACGEDETLVNVRGKPTYVVLPIEQYEYLSEAGLQRAVKEAQADYEAGNYVIESVSKHVKRVTK